MTTTAAISSQSVGTSTNVGEDKFPQKVTAASVTDRFFIEAIVTNGSDTYDNSNRVRVWYAAHSADLTAADAPERLRQRARYVDVVPSKKPNIVRANTSVCEPLSGAYIYLWCEAPTLNTAITLSVNVVEGP